MDLGFFSVRSGVDGDAPPICERLLRRSVAPRLNSASPDSGTSSSRARSDLPRRRGSRWGAFPVPIYMKFFLDSQHRVYK